jgi:hypothetical protein
MAFHYWTQPLPNPVSMLFHRLPFWVHKMETYATFVNESFAALFVFAPWPLRLIPFVLFEGLVCSNTETEWIVEQNETLNLTDRCSPISSLSFVIFSDARDQSDRQLRADRCAHHERIHLVAE